MVSDVSQTRLNIEEWNATLMRIFRDISVPFGADDDEVKNVFLNAAQTAQRAVLARQAAMENVHLKPHERRRAQSTPKHEVRDLDDVGYLG